MSNGIDTSVIVPANVAMHGKSYTKKWQQRAKQYRTYGMWWQLFYTAATTCFRWEDLPDGIDQRWVEQQLFLGGAVALTKRVTDSDVAPWVAARFTPQGMLDIYNNPNTIRMISGNGRSQWIRHANPWVKSKGNQYGKYAELMHPDAAICYDNLTRLPLFDAIDLACARLAEFDVTIDQNVRAARVPYMIAVPEEGKRNAEQFFNRVDSGQPCIYLTPSAMNQLSLQVLNTGVDYVVDKLLNDELKIVSQTYTLLGIDNNAAAEKKERVQTAETLANNEQFLIQRMSRQNARNDFTEKCERVFGIRPTATWAVPHVWEQDAGGDGYGSTSLEPYSDTMRTGGTAFSYDSGSGDTGGFGNV